MTKELRLDFGHGLNLIRAEDAVIQLTSSPPHAMDIALDLSQCVHIDVGASWRLGNIFRIIASTNKISVVTPEGIDPESRKWFKLFTHSGLGFYMARYATTIISGSRDITPAVRSYYSEPRSTLRLPVNAWGSSTLVYIPDIHSGDLPFDDPSDFNQIFATLLGASAFDLQAYSPTTVSSLLRLLYEAGQNIWDHADKPPLAEGTEILSSFALRYFKQIRPPKAATSEFSSFLQRLEEIETQDTRGFLELTVTDDGVGIAARHSQNPEIQKASFESELGALVAAFSDGGSIKLKLYDTAIRGTPGFGFTQIAQALRDINGFGLLRTGRALAYFDPTLHHDTFVPYSVPFGYLPGTVIQIVFPRRLARVWRHW